MKRNLLNLFLFFFLGTVPDSFAQLASTSDNLVAQPVADRTVTFDYFGTGDSKPMIWGMDAGGWTNFGIWELGKRYLGVENVLITRIPAFPGDTLLNGNELNQWQKDWIKDRINQAETGSGGAPMQIMLNPGGADDNDFWYRQDWSRYALLMKLAKDYIESFGHTVVSITGFNEPDPGYAPATMDDNYHLFEACQNSGYFEGVRFCGGNTLNPDFAYDWYSHDLAVGVNEGNTHQLAGTFDSYASFYQAVKANGHYATNDEVHDIMEAIVGAEYGLQAGIYWGYANLARGEFVKACNGVRLGYAEHRPKWTAAAVYRQTDGKVQAFLGGSERQATTTTYRFISKNRPVYFEGVGPRYDFVKELPGGSGYMTSDQYFAERVFNVSWGEDIQPAITGTYQLVNRQTGQAIEVAGDYNEANVYLATPSDINRQQWTISPLVSKYGNDASYYHIRPGSSTSRRLDLYNFSLDNGGKISLWDDGGAGNQQWYLEYSEDGWFYIRSRESTYCVQADESGNIVQWEKTGDNSQQWRFLPIDAEVEFDAPSMPENLVATGNASSVKLEWSASLETDIAGYDILRAESAGGPYNTIARSVNATAFVDNTALNGVLYFYSVRAVDHSLNRSAKSAEVSASATGENDLVEYLKFDSDTKDNTANLNHAIAQGGTFVTGRQGTEAIELNGSSDFIQLPANVANHQEISIATWVNWAGFNTGQHLFDFSSGDGDYLSFSPSVSGQMEFMIKSGGVEQILNASSLPASKWVYLVVTLGDNGASIYLDGTLLAESTAITIRPADFNPIISYIGVNQSTKKMFEGVIDDFRIYNYQLSGAQVSELYNDLTTDVYDMVLEESDLSVWPNPADDILHINYMEFSMRDYSNLQLLNMSGVVMMNIDIKSSGNTDLNVSGIATGTYLLRLTTGEGIITKKIIIKN